MRERERETEREREESGGTVEVSLYISFLFLFFGVILYLPGPYISICLHRMTELRLEKWVGTLVWLDKINESELQTVVCKEVEQSL